jgi:CheY-like chemotaxis protein
MPEEHEPPPKRPEEAPGIKPPARVTKPTHVDLPPPPDLKTLSTPPKTPSPSANRPSQIDITPGLQVLVVDDDKMTRMLFQRMLGRLKCQVTTAVNGYEALQLVTDDQNVSQTPAEEREHPFLGGEDHLSIKELERAKEEKESKFAIVFLDNQMPVMSGVEMVRKLRSFGRKDFVVGVTGEGVRFLTSIPDGCMFAKPEDLIMRLFVGNALLPDQEEYLEAGADFILTKPVREESVRKMLAIADERTKARSPGNLTVLTPKTPPLDGTWR